VTLVVPQRWPLVLVLVLVLELVILADTVAYLAGYSQIFGFICIFSALEQNK
jgi:hypothetical protein